MCVGIVTVAMQYTVDIERERIDKRGLDGKEEKEEEYNKALSCLIIL